MEYLFKGTLLLFQMLAIRVPKCINGITGNSDEDVFIVCRILHVRIELPDGALSATLFDPVEKVCSGIVSCVPFVTS